MKILNIGSCNIDYTYKVPHFLVPGETNASISLNVGAGGKGLNQSIALAQAGTEIYHCGLIGQEGLFLKEKMEEKGVHTDFVRTIPGSNGHAIIQVDPSGQNCILLHPGSNHAFTEEFIDEVLAHFDAGDILILQNEINNIPYIMKAAAAKGLRIAFNAAPCGEEILSYPLELLSYLIVNEVEGGYLSKKAVAPEEIISNLREKYPQTAILLTLGTDGSIYADASGIIRVPALKVKAVDTTAAGDTFIGFFMRGISDGMDVEASMKLASKASAIAVTRPGAADSVPSYAEVAE